MVFKIEAKETLNIHKCTVGVVSPFNLQRINEALSGGYLFPCSPEINWLVPLFLKNENLFSDVPCSPILYLFPSKFGLCSPEINAPFPCSPKTVGGPHINVHVIRADAFKKDT